MENKKTQQQINLEIARKVAEEFNRTNTKITVILGEDLNGRVSCVFGHNVSPDDFLRVIKQAMNGIYDALNKEES